MANRINLPRIAAGEATTVSFAIDESIAGWGLSARYGPNRNAVPWVTKSTAGTGGDLITIPGGTGGTGSYVLTSTDTGRTLGPGIWVVSLWRTDADLEARLAWGEQVILPSVADLPV